MLTRRSNLVRSTGLKTRKLAPASKARAVKPRSRSPVMMMIGVVRFKRDARICRQFDTIRRRHAHVEENRIELLCLETGGGLSAVRQGMRVEIGGAEDFANELAQAGIIFHDENLIG